MSSINTFIHSLTYWNGYMRFSLLLFVISYVVFHSCSTTSSPFWDGNTLVENEKGVSEYRKRQDIINTAKKHIGIPYKAGGKNEKGFDCSGFTYFVLKEHHISLHASSGSQYKQGKKVEIEDLKPGDLIFFGGEQSITHVGIIVENKNNELTMIHSSTSRGIVMEDIMKSAYWKKRIKEGRNILNL